MNMIRIKVQANKGTRYELPVAEITMESKKRIIQCDLFEMNSYCESINTESTEDEVDDVGKLHRIALIEAATRAKRFAVFNNEYFGERAELLKLLFDKSCKQDTRVTYTTKDSGNSLRESVMNALDTNVIELADICELTNDNVIELSDKILAVGVEAYTPFEIVNCMVLKVLDSDKARKQLIRTTQSLNKEMRAVYSRIYENDKEVSVHNDIMEAINTLASDFYIGLSRKELGKLSMQLNDTLAICIEEYIRCIKVQSLCRNKKLLYINDAKKVIKRLDIQVELMGIEIYSITKQFNF